MTAIVAVEMLAASIGSENVTTIGVVGMTPDDPSAGETLTTLGPVLSSETSPRSKAWPSTVNDPVTERTPFETTSKAAIEMPPSGMPPNWNRPLRSVVTCSTPDCRPLCDWKFSVTNARAAGVVPPGRSTRPRIVPDAPSRMVTAEDCPTAGVVPVATPASGPASPIAK